jgi:hypothetical protein
MALETTYIHMKGEGKNLKYIIGKISEFYLLKSVAHVINSHL